MAQYALRIMHYRMHTRPRRMTEVRVGLLDESHYRTVSTRSSLLRLTVWLSTCPQAVASRESKERHVDVAAVWLGGANGMPHVQLDAFTTRALRADMPHSHSVQRHLYVTEWCLIRDGRVTEDGGGAIFLLGDVDLRGFGLLANLVGSSDQLSTTLGGGAREALTLVSVAASQQRQQALAPLCVLAGALTLVQVQASVAAPPKVLFLTGGAQVGRCPDHSGVWGLARAVRTEAPFMSLQCIDTLAATALACSLLGEVEAMVHCGAVSVPHLKPMLPFIEGLEQPRLMHAHGSHAVTGGLGGLGLLAARWLAQQGAHTLALTSRSCTIARGAGRELVALLATPVPVLVEPCDAADPTSVRRLVLLLGGWVVGVWHTAGVVADGVLSRQSFKSLTCVYTPKAHGAYILQAVLLQMPLQSCLLFSSVAGILGLSGQANYAASNVCLDALSIHRRLRGGEVASVQWGAWAEVGMAARGAAASRVVAAQAAAGIVTIELKQGLEALGIASQPQAPPVFAVLPMELARAYADRDVPALLSDVLTHTSQHRPAQVRDHGLAAETESAASLEMVLTLVERVAGVTAAVDEPLMEAGVDSAWGC